MNNKMWKKKTGETIRMSDMTTEHLQNSINMMRRNGYVTFREAFSCLNALSCPHHGDMAAYYLEGETEQAFNRANHILDDLEEELGRRKEK